MRKLAVVLLLIVTALGVSPALASSRRFTYVYEVTTSPPGDVEIENWVTWRTRKVDFRHEFEFGITEKFQAAVYLADWTEYFGSPPPLVDDGDGTRTNHAHGGEPDLQGLP